MGRKVRDPIIPKGRLSFFKEYLFRNGYGEMKLYIETVKNGTVHYAYPEIVCMAMIEYFAFEAQRTNEIALANFRRLARYGLQKFIYDALGYVPEDKWKYFHDRVSLLKDAAPEGHFIVFKESNGLAIDLISAGLPVNHKTLPDASVGIAWGKHWVDSDLSTEFGERIRYEHNFPPEYPQSASNPQPAWAYPDAGLAEFRRWFRHEYLLTKFPKYILSKAKILSGGENEALKIAGLYEVKKLR